MVTYCTGHPGVKRREFRQKSGETGNLYVDNDEVSAFFTLSGKHYCVAGKTPFGDFTVDEFIRFRRALKDRMPPDKKAVLKRLRAFGVQKSVRAKMSRLSRAEYRAVVLAADWDETVKTLYVNFDGLCFCPKTARSVSRFLKIWSRRFRVFAGVSDIRFIPRAAEVLDYGDPSVFSGKTTKRIGKFALGRRLKKAGFSLALPNGQQIVMIG